MRLRRSVQREPLLILSVLADFAIVLIANIYFGVSLWVLLLIPAIDIVRKAGRLTAGLLLINGILLGFLVKDMKVSEISAAVLLFTAFVYFSFIIKKRNENIEQLKFLFDDQRKAAYELEAAKKQIEEYSKKSEELAQTQERDRLSQEIHDTVGHRLTALLMQLEAAALLTEKGDEKGQKLLEESRSYLRETIDVLRQTVRKLKPKETLNFIDTIKIIAEDFSKKTDTQIKLDISGQPYPVMPSVSLIIINNMREALTNSVRHGKAKNINVSLDFKQSGLELVVTDDGRGCGNIVKGMGLKNMEERLKFIGGKLIINGKDGFSVKSVIPLKGGNM